MRKREEEQTMELDILALETLQAENESVSLWPCSITCREESCACTESRA
jgi:hypothetical protein